MCRVAFTKDVLSIRQTYLNHNRITTLCRQRSCQISGSLRRFTHAYYMRIKTTNKKAKGNRGRDSNLARRCSTRRCATWRRRQADDNSLDFYLKRPIECFRTLRSTFEAKNFSWQICIDGSHQSSRSRYPWTR